MLYMIQKAFHAPKMQNLGHHLALRKVSPFFFLLKYQGRIPSSHYYMKKLHEQNNQQRGDPFFFIPPAGMKSHQPCYLLFKYNVSI